jgi:hypothetical protein
MINRIREHVESLFLRAPATKRAGELRDELVSNLTARYNDLISQGLDEEAAYKSTIDGIGDVDELINSLREQEVFDPMQAQIQRQKSALLISSGVALYIISLIFPFIFGGTQGDPEVIGVVLMFVCWAVATMLIVYNAVSKPRYIKYDNTVVEDFKEWKSDKVKKDSVQKSLYSIVWMAATVLFFVFGLFWNLWDRAWLLFLLAPVVIQIMKLVSVYKEEK